MGRRSPSQEVRVPAPGAVWTRCPLSQGLGLSVPATTGGRLPFGEPDEDEAVEYSAGKGELSDDGI